jgi:class 3 adenylate cyclase/tetratricopeptide (TPR) repeat protein
MFCPACGTEVSSLFQPCPRCGAGLAAHCSNCQAELPPAAKFCPACGRPVQVLNSGLAAQKAAAPGHTERKQVTVLFADFSGFTTFAHKRDVEDVRDFMSSVWEKLDGIIATHGGTTEKHIGDAVMAVFGAKQAREEDPAQAVHAALAMQASVKQFALESTVAPLQMRIGVHTGLAVVGPLSSLGEFAVTGDTVNLASRLQASAPTGGVLVSHDTYRHIHGFFDVQTLPPFEVKGRPELVQAYIVLRAKPRALAMQFRGIFRGIEGIQSEMVGREKELSFLQSALHRVIDEQDSQVITIIGEAGIGKSCLLSQFQEWVELLPESIRIFYGRANRETPGLPFSLLRDVFANRFEIQDSDSSALAREKLERGVVELLGRNEDLFHAHFIGQLLGLDFASSPWLREILNDPGQIRHRAFQSFAHFFKAVTRGSFFPSTDSPINGAILYTEDIHWSDDGSLDLLVHLARTCRRVPLLIVCLARPTLFERRPRWCEEFRNCQRLDLQPLQRQQSLALVESLLRRAPKIPQALRELIIGGAEGIPFYIEEIIKMLIDQKVILPGPEQWRIEPEGLATARVPPTLMGVLQARLDGLQPVERLVLQRAAVIGRTFWDSAVENLSKSTGQNAPVEFPVSRGEILDALAALRRKELIFRRESSAFANTTEYAFKHDLLRSVAYESLLRKSRRAYHGQLAAWLIEKSRERINEVAALVASHFEQAGDRTNGSEWFGRAGQQARAGYSPATAIDYFQKALALLPGNSDIPVCSGVPMPDGHAAKRLEWLGGLSEVLGAQARFNEALDACNQFHALAESVGDPVMQARAFNGLAFLQERLGRNRASIEFAEKAEALARAAGEAGRPEWVRSLLLKGWAYYRLSDASAVLALGEQARKLCHEFGNFSGLATSHKLLGVAHLQLGHFSDADRFFDQGLAIYEDLDDRRNSAAMLSNLGESARARGDYSRAEELYEKALSAVRQIGHRESEAIYLSNLSAARLGLRKYQQVEVDAREALALVGSNFCAHSETYAFLSEACLGQGKLEASLDAANHALDLARESENDLDLGIAWRTLARVLAACKTCQLASASAASLNEICSDPEACFHESHRIFRKINAASEAARTLRAWAEFDLQTGRVLEGNKKIEEAQSIFRRIGVLAPSESTAVGTPN